MALAGSKIPFPQALLGPPHACLASPPSSSRPSCPPSSLPCLAVARLSPSLLIPSPPCPSAPAPAPLSPSPLPPPPPPRSSLRPPLPLTAVPPLPLRLLPQVRKQILSAEVGYFHLHSKGVEWVFVDHPSYPRPGGMYADAYGPYGDNIVGARMMKGWYWKGGGGSQICSGGMFYTCDDV